LVDQQTLIFIVIGLVAAAVIAWAIVRGSSKSTPEAVTRDGHEKDVSPVITGPAAAPIDVPPAVDATPTPEAAAADHEETPAPAAIPVEEPAPAPAGPPDDLTRMKGVGPKVAALLTSLGVTRFDQIAAWSDDDVARIDAQLGAFKGRIVRDQWVEQARLLAAGDTAAYEAKFGKLG
jgi:predicted flap endonuclease-1-like 5' DNA nuclease